MDVEGGMDGPGFLDTIPEDVSVVAASQHAVNLSTVSAVASSDSEGRPGPRSNIVRKKRRGGRRRRKQDEGETDPARVLESTGGGVMGDDVSDANASLCGSDEDCKELRNAALGSNKRPKAGDPSKSVFLSPKCKKWSLIFLGIVSVLAVAVGIGMYVILVKMPSVGDNGTPVEIEPTTATQSPTKEIFMTISFATEAPTSSPVYSPEEIEVLDSSFKKVSGTTIFNIMDMNTPEGKARDWMVNSDAAINVNEEQRVQQRYILSVLHFATNGDFWKKKFNWMSAERSECDWYGITCNNENNIIERIDLSENNVTGFLPNEIASLSNLVSLNVSFDNISGTIPIQMFELLDELEVLDMQENQISGTVPKRTTSRLSVLNLGSNQLTGAFPFFPNVESLSFDMNELRSIDTRYWTVSPSLKVFRGFHNRFSGPLPSIWNLPELVELDLGYNFWSGNIPQDLWNLPSLKTLWLDHCNLTGPLPNYSESSNMHRLWLDSNLLSGTIPLGFGWNWTKLYSVKLQENQLTGSITPEQCDRWSADSMRGRVWAFDTDCQIDCACCTNANCR